MVVAGIIKICGMAGIAPGEIHAVFHGTTVATNMVIERTGAEVGMITTRGFRDILHMARHKRPHNFSAPVDVPGNRSRWSSGATASPSPSGSCHPTGASRRRSTPTR